MDNDKHGLDPALPCRQPRL